VHLERGVYVWALKPGDPKERPRPCFVLKAVDDRVALAFGTSNVHKENGNVVRRSSRASRRWGQVGAPEGLTGDTAFYPIDVCVVPLAAIQRVAFRLDAQTLAEFEQTFEAWTMVMRPQYLDDLLNRPNFHQP
jgi:hypothetical protein